MTDQAASEPPEPAGEESSRAGCTVGRLGREWREGWPVGPAELCQDLLLNDHDGRITVDDWGSIIYVNRAAADLFDRSLEELRGANLADFLCEKSLRVAGEMLVQLQATAEEDVPADLDLLRPDGSTVPVQVAVHRYLEHPDHPGLHLQLRPVADQRWMERFLTHLASGAPLETCLTDLARAVDAAIPHTRSVILHQWDGIQFRSVVAPNVDPAFIRSGRRAFRALADPTVLPWARAMESGKVEYAVIDDMPLPFRAAMIEADLTACWSYPVAPDPTSDPIGAVVVWREVGGAPLVSQGMSMSRLTGAVALAIERDQSHRALVRAATRDALTGLLNREELLRRLTMLLERNPSSRLAVAYIDLDRFKPINDAHGHRFGDDLLALVGNRLRSVVRPIDHLARIGGDEFVVVFPEVGDEATAEALVQELVDCVDTPFELYGQPVTVGASAGLAMWPYHGTNPVELIDAADRALYAAKRAGRGRVHALPLDEAPVGRR